MLEMLYFRVRKRCHQKLGCACGILEGEEKKCHLQPATIHFFFYVFVTVFAMCVLCNGEEKRDWFLMWNLVGPCVYI